MSQQVRLLLSLLISGIILMVWSSYYAPKPRPKAPPAPAAANAPAEPAPAAPPTIAPAVPGAPGEPPVPVEPEPAVEPVAVEQPGYWKAVFTTKGAGLQSFVLQGDKQHKHTGGGQAEGVELAHPGLAQGRPAPLSVELGGAPLGLGGDLVYRKVSQTDRELVFERTKGPYTVRKTFRFEPNSYRLQLDVAVTRAGGALEPLPVKVLYPAFEEQPSSPGVFSQGEVHQGACYVAGERSMETRHYGTEGKPPLVPEKPAAFAAIDEKYFLAAIAPVKPAEARCEIAAPSATELVAALQVQPAVEGASATASFDLFLGPKKADLLEHSFGHGAEVAVYDGSIAKAGKLLLPILRFFQGFVSNWGIAIILLTLLVKVVTFPLAHKQMVSMEKMKLLGPKMEEIKRKFEADPQRQQAETLKLYKEHDVNPVGCAVPMLVQMPIWWALYSTLQNSYDLYNEPFFGWIHDLTARDPFYVLPVLMTVTMVLTSVLTPQTSPQAQQMKAMTYGMPVMFGFMMMSLPSGLVLYIFTNNLLSIGQSLWFRRTQAAKLAT